MSCGAAVAAGPGSIAAEPLSTGGGAERRRISVLFVDLENFTTLAESLDPEEVRTVQSRYFEAARSVVARYGGTIEKFIGDAVMAVWGAPVAHEDDAERAVRAALEIVHAVGRLGGAASGRNLTARAAVTTGQAAVTIGAVGQGMVAGDLVNIAARLQSLAPVGSVLVDAATREMADGAASFESLGSLNLRGRTARLAAFRATAAGGAGAQPGRVRGQHTGPFVGRDRELRELSELFSGVVRERRSRLVSVTGIAGIGKSRLAWEFHEYIESLPEDVAWHAGRAPAYGDDITFAAVAEMVRRRIRLTDDVPPDLARLQLASALGEFVRDESERRWMEPRVGALLGGDAGATFEREELFAAWRRFFERVSDLHPTVLVFEDLQWADPSLLDFIEHLAGWTREHPILILGLARPELIDRRPAWGTGMGSFTALGLERLPDTAMRELLSGHAPDLAAPLVHQILERAGGVPLYAVEVIRILADRRTDGACEQPEPPPATSELIVVPHSLHGLIAARIDALPGAERRLLLGAALLGRRFRLDALVALAGSDPVLTRERIDSLVRRELLAVDDELTSPGHGELGFVQDLVREVAYQTLGRAERRSLHLAAARYLESRGDDDVAESLAHHLVEVHHLAPDHSDAPRIARRAVAALRQAAGDAIRLHVPERALGQLDHALRLNEVPEHRAALLDEAATAARAAGRLEIAERHLRERVSLLAQAETPHEEARARAKLASVLLTAQRNEPALQELESALEAIEDAGSDASGVELAAQLARARMLVGENRAGLEWADRALADARRLGMQAVAADILITRGTARFRLGQEAEGLSDLRTAIGEAEDGGALAVELRARNNLAWLSVADDPRVTLETGRQGYELATAMGVGDLAVQLADVACAAAIDTGDWAWALETASALDAGTIPDEFRIDIGGSVAIIHALQGQPEPMAAIDAMHPLPAETDRQVLASVQYARAWAAFVAGAFEEARAFAIEAARDSLGAERAQAWTLATRASLWLGDPESAASGLRELDGLGLSGRSVRASSQTLTAGVAAIGGNDNARVLYRRAWEAWRDLDLPLHLALALLDADRLLGEEDGTDGGEAFSILATLGAEGLLATVGALVGVSPGASPRRPARSRRPTAGTARRTGADRHPPRATGRPAPPG
jgi:class 3 adenylate cyclase/tetratricopeptide (TPR) repeat protein